MCKLFTVQYKVHVSLMIKKLVYTVLRVSLITRKIYLNLFYPVNVPMLLLTYGVVGGFGLGLIFLPAVVCVGHYFESKAGNKVNTWGLLYKCTMYIHV